MDGRTMMTYSERELTFTKNYWTELHENFAIDVSVDKAELIKFWNYLLPNHEDTKTEKLWTLQQLWFNNHDPIVFTVDQKETNADCK